MTSGHFCSIVMQCLLLAVAVLVCGAQEAAIVSDADGNIVIETDQGASFYCGSTDVAEEIQTLTNALAQQQEMLDDLTKELTMRTASLLSGQADFQALATALASATTAIEQIEASSSLQWLIDGHFHTSNEGLVISAQSGVFFASAPATIDVVLRANNTWAVTEVDALVGDALNVTWPGNISLHVQLMGADNTVLADSGATSDGGQTQFRIAWAGPLSVVASSTASIVAVRASGTGVTADGFVQAAPRDGG
jgi:hypothetical protein